MGKVEEMVKEAASYLLEAELLEENGWTKENKAILRKLAYEDFEVIFKSKE